MKTVQVIGGGPAGASAALSALASGAIVRVHERSRFPRHKVCGEFLSPEIAPVLDRLGVFESFMAQCPARIQRMVLHFGARERRSHLPQAAYGMSRYTLDQLLLQAAERRGAKVLRGTAEPGDTTVWTPGRPGHAETPKEERIFGFKAHFSGPAEDAVELFFFRDCYIGVNAIEGELTNICGLGPWSVLSEFNFDIDKLVAANEPLRDRLRGMLRRTEWMHTGPLVFQHQLDKQHREGLFPAGDALSFVDPFTGSGVLSALLTGELAGRYAAEGRSTAEYLTGVRAVLHRPFQVASTLRKIAGTALAELIAPVIPSELLFRWTRPKAG